MEKRKRERSMRICFGRLSSGPLCTRNPELNRDGRINRERIARDCIRSSQSEC